MEKKFGKGPKAQVTLKEVWKIIRPKKVKGLINKSQNLKGMEKGPPNTRRWGILREGPGIRGLGAKAPGGKKFPRGLGEPLEKKVSRDNRRKFSKIQGAPTLWGLRKNVFENPSSKEALSGVINEPENSLPPSPPEMVEPSPSHKGGVITHYLHDVGPPLIIGGPPSSKLRCPPPPPR